MQDTFTKKRTAWQFLCIVGLAVSSSFQPLILGTGALADEYNPAFARGMNHFASRDYDDAINDFNEAIGFDDRNSKAYFKRGQCFFNLNNYSLAIKDFDEAIKQNPDSSDFFLYRGTAYAKSGEDDQAIRDYVKAIRLDPKLRQAYTQQSKGEATFGNARQQSGRQGQLLIDDSHKEILISPRTSKAALNDKNKGAVEDYRIAMKMSAQNDAAYFNAGTAYSGITKPEGIAVPQHHGLENSDNRVRDNALVQDVVDMKVEKPAKAVRDFSATLELEPTNDLIYYKRARAFQQLGQSDKALRDFSQAITFNPLAKYYLARAYLYNQISKPALAQADIDNARSVDATLPEHITFEKGMEKN
jgi:tetratricopeptide (TPR) repeat protein